MTNKLGSFPWSLSSAQQELAHAKKSDPQKPAVLLEPTVEDLAKVIQLCKKSFPLGCTINVKVIHNPVVLDLYVARMKALEKREKDKKNTPRWDNDENVEVRSYTRLSLEKEAEQYPSTYKNVKFVLMAATGITALNVKTISTTGYHDFSFISSGSLGQGISNTSSIKYALIHGEAIVLNFVGYHLAYPVVSSNESLTKNKRLLHEYDARYALMTPRDGSKPNEVLFEPIKKGKNYVTAYDELVTPPEQVLPKYQVTLVPPAEELTKQIVPTPTIKTLKKVIDIYLLQNKRDGHLNLALKRTLERLEMESNDRDPLDPAGIALWSILARMETLTDSFAQRNLSAKLRRILVLQGLPSLSPNTNENRLISSIKKATDCQKKIDQAHLLAIEGEKYRLQGKTIAAFSSFDKALKKDPTHPLALCKRGALYANTNQWDEALKDFDQVTTQHPFNASAFAARANLFHSQSNFSRALEDSQRALELDPNSAVAYQVRGACHFINKQSDLALDDYNNALELDPDNSFALAQRGQILWSMNRLDEAFTDLKKCKDIDLYPPAREIQGELFFHSKDYDNALTAFNKCAKEKNSSNINVYTKIGIIYRIKKSYGLSLEHLDLALKMDTSNITTLTELGLTYAAAGIQDQALDSFNKVLLTNPNNLIAKAGRGELYLLNREKEKAFANFSDVAKAYFADGNFEQALIYIDKCLDLIPKNTDFLKKRAFIKAKENVNDGIQNYNQCILIDNFDMETLYARGTLHFSKGNFPLALSDFDRCCTLDPQNTKALLGRAKVYCRMEKPIEALRDFNEVLRLDPNNLFAKSGVDQLSSNPSDSSQQSQQKREHRKSWHFNSANSSMVNQPSSNTNLSASKTLRSKSPMRVTQNKDFRKTWAPQDGQ